jgi:hypothetical protein
MRPLLLAALLALPAVALADRGPRLPPDPTYQAECGSCHVPYPPRLLPAQSWSRTLARLERHFGTDASVDEPTLKELSAFLERHAGQRAAPVGDEPRITQTAWFRKEHRKAKPSNAADCAACHTGAAQGDYSERTLRVPK